MKTRTIILALALLTSSQFSIGQDAPEPCSFTTIMEVEAESNSIYQRSWFNLEKRLQEMQEAAPLRNDEVFTIPVVVHVIHTGEAIGSGPNISDEQVFSAIQALNEDFRKIAGTNGDGIGVDTGIEFCLAVRDPQGNSTTGIVRVDGSVLPAYAADGIQATGDVGAPELEVKSLSNWPIQDYMNIWVVSEIEGNNAQGGIQGYSRFPVNSIVDGLVVLYNAIGTVGNLKSSTALNRTVTHEVGHYLGLYHTFHLTNNCNGESNCNTQGDRVCDTPQTVSSPSCSTQGCGNQQVENYLDYTPQSCMNAFTDGQRTRMRNTILADRSSLLESFGCASVNNNDAGITSVSHPSGSLCSAQVNPVVRLTNFGSETLTSCTIHYATNNTVFANFAWSGSIAPSTSQDVELPLISGTMGENLFSAWTTNPNGVPDEGPDNDEFEIPFTVSTGETVTVTVNVDFFGQESTWAIKQGETVMASGGPFQNYSQGSIFSESVCIAHGCYTFFMYDSHGDGMSFTIGSYEVVNSEGLVLASGGGNFGYEAEHLFCLDAPDEPEEPDPVPPIAGFTASNNSGCGNANVSFTNTSSGATSYSWSFPGGSPSSSTANNPTVAYNSPGNYSVTLTATNSDGSTSITQNNVVTVFSQPTASISASAITCNGANNGGLTASASGGGGGFQYQWSNNATGASINNLVPGNYTVTITDANGCTATASQSLTNPPAMNVTLTHNSISCNGLNNGSINSSTSGGALPYTYSWSNGATTSNVSDLTAGSYTLTVTDANGCTATASQSLTNPPAMNVNLTHNSISCNGLNNGSINSSTSGGVQPYTYSWSNGAATSNVSDLTAGSYTLTVTDANGCTATASQSLTNPPAMNVTLTHNSISCNGLNNGSINSSTSGGALPYTYSWSNGAATSNVSDLTAGSYTLTVTDANGCTATASQSLTNPPAMNVTLFKSDITCNGLNNGSINATPNGGTQPYSYSWSHGATTPNISGLTAGSYTLTVTDANGCQGASTAQIAEPTELVLNIDEITAETCDGNNGSAVLNAMGGTAPLTIQWSNGSLGQHLTGASAGTNLVTVTDANGCSVQEVIDIPYDCEEAPDGTRLTDEFCSATGLMLDDMIECIPVEDAILYHWRFSSASTGFQAEGYTAENNTGFVLEHVSQQLAYGMTVGVSIRIQNGAEIWSEWGQQCFIALAETIPLTALESSDCNADFFQPGTMIMTEVIAGAQVYEWSFYDGADSTIFSTFLPQLSLPLNEPLEEGQLYTISVRSEVADQWSDWGSECEVQFGEGTSVRDLAENDPHLQFWPNPNTGEKISFRYRNLFTSDPVIELEVYDGSGKLVENKRLSHLASQGELTIQFNRRLQPGMYFLRTRTSEGIFEEKIIVQ